MTGQTSLNFPVLTSVFSTQVEPNLMKLCTITKQEVVFQVLVLIFRSAKYEFAAAILEKGLLALSQSQIE